MRSVATAPAGMAADGGRVAPRSRDLAEAARDLRWVLALCRGGAPSGGVPDDWRAVLAIARAERCAPLAWLRGGALIRERAPAAVAGQWRALVILEHEATLGRMRAMHDVVRALRGDGLSPVVLKGAPLSQRLYGVPFARPHGDVDLYVPASERAAARTTLERRGWRRREGEAPWEEVFERVGAPGAPLVEVHSHVLGDLLAHLPVRDVGSRMLAVGGDDVPVHDGALLPAYLAAHLARHQLPPLLWVLDLAALWSELSAAEREAAERAARAARLGRYLSWGLALAAAIPGAIEGSTRALAALGVTGSERRDRAAAPRLVALAAGPVDAARVLGAWAWPRPIRRDRSAFAARCAHRLRSRAAALTSRRLPYADSAPPHAAR